jgi:hypothetical protein
MSAHAAKPVSRVGIVWLTAVHQTVPVTARGRFDFLTNLMRFVQEIVSQPESGEATGCHVVIMNRRGCEGPFHGKGIKACSRRLLAATRS